jgi:hypothetical protein
VLFPRDAFYAWQALAMPALVALTALCARLLPRLTRAPNAATLHARAWALTYLGLYLLPEMLLYAALGFDALGRAFLVAFPLANLGLAIKLFLDLRRETTGGRALLGAALGVLVVGLVLAPVVR